MATMTTIATNLLFPAPSADGGCQIAIQFQWREDRFVQEVGYVVANEFFPVLRSVDGDGVLAWPPSPPLQNLHEQTVNGRQVLMGLGAAGTTHWSAAFEASNNQIVCHFAARIQNKAEFLGSTFQKPSIADQHKVMDELPLIELVAIDGSKSAVPTNLKNSPIVVLPPPCSSTARQTVQWKFAFRQAVNSSIDSSISAVSSLRIASALELAAFGRSV